MPEPRTDMADLRLTQHTLTLDQDVQRRFTSDVVNLRVFGLLVTLTIVAR